MEMDNFFFFLICWNFSYKKQKSSNYVFFLVYSGWLLKWTNYLKGYQRRWFVLSNGVLSYYRQVFQTLLIEERDFFFVYYFKLHFVILCKYSIKYLLHFNFGFQYFFYFIFFNLRFIFKNDNFIPYLTSKNKKT